VKVPEGAVTVVVVVSGEQAASRAPRKRQGIDRMTSPFVLMQRIPV